MPAFNGGLRMVPYKLMQRVFLCTYRDKARDNLKLGLERCLI